MVDSPTTDADGVVTLTVLSNGSPLDSAIELASVVVQKRVNRIASASLVIFDGDMPSQDFPNSNADTFVPGAEIEIKAGYASNEATLFKGVVVRHGIKIGGNNDTRLVVECRDKAVAMTLGRNNANYLDQKDSDVINTLIGNHSGLTADVDATTVQHRELVQFHCTDWDFMLTRAEANGLLVLVDDGTVKVKAPDGSATAVLALTYGLDLIELDADMDARSQLQSVKTVSWDETQQAIVEQTASATTLTGQGNLSSADLAKVVGPDAYVLQSNAPVSTDMLKGWAQGRQLRAELARIRGRVRFQGSSKAAIGGLVELNGVGDRFNGKVYVSAVRHELAGGQWLTDVEFGLPDELFAERRDLVTPPAAGLVPGVEGLQIGVVKQLDQDPDGDYRIQVSLPLLQALTDGVWARLSTFYASDKFGAFFIPEIGDEVVLGYLNNDPAHPIVLGSLYSGKRTPPYEPAAENNTKALVTRSTLKVEFDEEKKVITLITPANNQLVLSDDGKSILLKDQNDNQVELSPDGILMSSPKDIQIKADGKIDITAVGNVSVSSNADVAVQGMNVDLNADVGLTAKGSATAELSASGQTTVKGAMVMIN